MHLIVVLLRVEVEVPRVAAGSSLQGVVAHRGGRWQGLAAISLLVHGSSWPLSVEATDAISGAERARQITLRGGAWSEAPSERLLLSGSCRVSVSSGGRVELESLGARCLGSLQAGVEALGEGFLSGSWLLLGSGTAPWTDSASGGEATCQVLGDVTAFYLLEALLK